MDMQAYQDQELFGHFSNTPVIVEACECVDAHEVEGQALEWHPAT
jgi:hypothetical protein